MTIFFATSSLKKFEEAISIIPNLELLEVNLPEIQELDTKNILEHKLNEALKHAKGQAVIVEDTSLHMNCLKGLPGPLIKWFLQAIGNDGLFELSQKYKNAAAKATTTLGFATPNHKKIHFFEHSLSGTIVSPKGLSGFGWDAIFQPEKLIKTFAQMTPDEKKLISMRTEALKKLKKLLDEKS